MAYDRRYVLMVNHGGNTLSEMECAGVYDRLTAAQTSLHDAYIDAVEHMDEVATARLDPTRVFVEGVRDGHDVTVEAMVFETFEW